MNEKKHFLNIYREITKNKNSLLNSWQKGEQKTSLEI